MSLKALQHTRDHSPIVETTDITIMCLFLSVQPRFATCYHGRHCGGGKDTVVAEIGPMASELLSLCPSCLCQMPLDELW